MSCDRVFTNLAMLHINKNDTHVPSRQLCYDSLFKIHPILDSLTIKFQKVYMPEEELTTDKVICAF